MKKKFVDEVECENVRGWSFADGDGECIVEAIDFDEDLIVEYEVIC